MNKKIEKDRFLSFAKCKKILEENGDKYTDEEIVKIRSLLYKLAQLEYSIYKSGMLHSKENQV